MDPTLLNGAGAALNLALGLLVWRARPRSWGSRIVSALLVANGIGATARLAAILAGDADAGGGPDRTTWPVGYFAYNLLSLMNYLTLTLLLVLPLAHPWRRVSLRTLLLVAGACVVALLPAILNVVLKGPLDPPSWPTLTGAGFTIAFLYVPAIALLLMLDATLEARDQPSRNQASLLLLAYVLMVATRIAIVPTEPGGAWFPDLRAVPADPDAMTLFVYAARVLVHAAILAVPVALAWRAWRVRSEPGEAVRAVAVVGIVLAATQAMRFAALTFEVEFLIARPLLLATGFLTFRMLDVDLRRQRVALAVAVVAATILLDGVLGDVGERLGFSPPLAQAGALVVALACVGAGALPLARIVLAPEAPVDGKRLLVYRAAVAARLREDRRGDAAAELAALRHEIGVTQHEHDEIVDELRAHAELRPGVLLSRRYRILGQLGSGGSGVVVLARDEASGQDVAVKRLGESARRDAAALARFQREAALASTLRHPNLVATRDVIQEGGDTYLVMEYLGGGTLEARVRRDGPLAPNDAAKLAANLLDALHALHERGIVHRDVKPANVLFDESGRAKLGDFTLARAVVSGETVGITSDVAPPAGTLAYMSPEQARGLPAARGSDLYAVGATIYFALVAAPPVIVAGLGEYDARRRIVEDAPALERVAAPAEWLAWLARALEKDPSRRFASARAMREALPEGAPAHEPQAESGAA